MGKETGLTLNWAAVYLEAGEKIRRHAWDHKYYLHLNRFESGASTITFEAGHNWREYWKPKINDLVATDWEVIR